MMYILEKSIKTEYLDKFHDIAGFAKAISHPARIAILETLAMKNSSICGEIVGTLPLSQATVSQHLKGLRDAGIVQGKIQGPASCYSVNYSNLKKNFEQLTELINKLIKNSGSGEIISSCKIEKDSPGCS